MEESQWYAPSAVQSLQRKKLQTLLQHAQSNTTFYQERLGHAPTMLRSRSLGETLDSIPLLDKQTIRESFDQMLWNDAPGGLYKSHTGGSSGNPLTFVFDRRRQGFDQAARIRSHRWFGVDAGDRELYLWGSPIEQNRSNKIKRVRDALFNHRLLSAFSMSPSRMDDYLEILRQYQPVCLFGYPSSLTLLAQHAVEQGNDLCLSQLRAVFVTGEVCYSHQRKIISDVYGATVADGYGSREAGFIAHQCPQGSMHITAENVIVEIVGDNEQSLPVGESGEIVITHLDAYAMPFIRYRTGDMGSLIEGRCNCGRGLPMMNIVQGRTTDFLQRPDGTTMHALSVIYPIREMSGVRQFHVTQHKDFSIQVDVVVDDKNERITRESVSRSIRPVIGEQILLSVNLVDHIKTTESGKYRYVESHAIAKSNLQTKETVHLG